MWEWTTYLLKWFLIGGGSAFVIIGGIGILRFPDLFTRFHAAGVTDTLGAGMILGGLMIEAGLTLISFKLLLIIIFLFITSPTATHALAKAALHGGITPLGSKLKPEQNTDADNGRKPS